MKVAPTKWNPDNLHRHADYAPTLRAEKADPGLPDPQLATGQKPTRTASAQTPGSNGTELEDEFGGNLFEGVDFDRTDGNDDSAYDSMLLDTAEAKAEQPGQPQQRQVARVQSMPSIRPTNGAGSGPQQTSVSGKPMSTANMNAPPRPERPQQHVQTPSLDSPQPGRAQHQPAPAQAHVAQAGRKTILTPPVTSEASDSDPSNQAQAQAQQQHPQDAPVRFVTGRAADLLLKAEAANRPPPQPPAAFNPHAESPSLRRTNGFNHSTSAPVKRLNISGQQTATNGSTASGVRPNFVNPQTDLNRRIGMPGAGQSPLANRSMYKPPSLKRPAEAPTRPVLADMTNVPTDGAVDGADNKKPRVGESEKDGQV